MMLRCVMHVLILVLHNVCASNAEDASISHNQGYCYGDTKIGLLSTVLIVIVIILILLILILLYIARKQQEIIEQTRNKARENLYLCSVTEDHLPQEAMSMKPRTLSSAPDDDDEYELVDQLKGAQQSQIPSGHTNVTSNFSYEKNRTSLTKRHSYCNTEHVFYNETTRQINGSSGFLYDKAHDTNDITTGHLSSIRRSAEEVCPNHGSIQNSHYQELIESKQSTTETPQRLYEELCPGTRDDDELSESEGPVNYASLNDPIVQEYQGLNRPVLVDIATNKENQ